MSSVYASTTRIWFDTLARIKPSVVAFWQPTPARPHDIETGERWYFKELGAPQIIGYAEYLRYEQLTARELFNKYGGASGYSSLDLLVGALRDFHTNLSAESIIGNVVLSGFTSLTPFIPLASVSLPDLSVRFVYLKKEDPIARLLGGFSGSSPVPTSFQLRDPLTAKAAYAKRKTRSGQNAFRQLLLGIYGSNCAVTGSQPEEVLQAAHIQPYVDALSNHVTNGFLLRADVHLLFDLGLLTIRKGFIAVSQKLTHRSPEIGTAWHGKPARLENLEGIVPSDLALDFRNKLFENAEKDT